MKLLHLRRKRPAHAPPAPYLVVEQRALQRAVDGLGVVLRPHLEDVFLRGEELLAGLLQEGGALGPVHRTQVGHLVTAHLGPQRERGGQRTTTTRGSEENHEQEEVSGEPRGGQRRTTTRIRLEENHHQEEVRGEPPPGGGQWRTTRRLEENHRQEEVRGEPRAGGGQGRKP